MIYIVQSMQPWINLKVSRLASLSNHEVPKIKESSWYTMNVLIPYQILPFYSIKKISKISRLKNKTTITFKKIKKLKKNKTTIPPKIKNKRKQNIRIGDVQQGFHSVLWDYDHVFEDQVSDWIWGSAKRQSIAWWCKLGWAYSPKV